MGEFDFNDGKFDDCEIIDCSVVKGLKSVAKNIEDSINIMPEKFGDIVGPIGKTIPPTQKIEDFAEQIKTLWSGMLNGHKIQLNAIFQELNSLIIVRNHLQSIVNGIVPRTPNGVSFVVCEDEESKLRKLIKKLDFDIISKSLSALELYEANE